MGLTVVLNKTEAVYFKQPWHRPPPQLHIVIEGVRIEVQPSIKYLGLHLDCQWLSASRKSLAVVRGLQRRLAIRITRGYKTTPAEAALAVSGSIPWELQAEAYAMYEWRTNLRREGEILTPRTKEVARTQFRQLAIEKWKERLAHVSAGLRAVGAIRPVLEDWMDRRPKGLPFRTVQVLTGHGCFEHCSAWDELRRDLRNIVGDDLSLPIIVAKTVENEDAWDAMVSLCENVISQKEAAERVREDDPDADPIRRRRGVHGGALTTAKACSTSSRKA
ncbi:uncharacterized protein LOC112637680 [Camponotus floridanus]|uniref:uncharacterized protein LOC112637680 n=1 Tax=Camponotus floridanus TaxID=104421 RepID=UPI000DC6C44E|nr:uncharacterized protein LOC112637680 [Camponotus floridanus]